MVYASPEAYDEFVLNNISKAAIISIILQFDRMNRGILKTIHTYNLQRYIVMKSFWLKELIYIPI